VSDGSGLSILDQATPRSLVQLLAYERRVPEAEVFWRSLPVAGDGLEGRMEDTPAEGHLRAKTGTLKNASALAGYVSAADGEELAFSIIVNDAWRIQRARRIQDQIGAKLAEFTR
jgi:D-alanyl-D-alanine carboxypeptidase/D-alanyl-D-alanine-endopeptidase (penicillin-binding protein 4)